MILQTYTGQAFDVLAPKPDAIFLQDIAHSLAHQCRFNGHCDRFYSVAEHTVRGLDLIALYGREAQRVWMLHDAAEAYLGDLISPLKATAFGDEYRRIEARISAVIYERFGVAPGGTEIIDAVVQTDRMMCRIEASQMMEKPLVGNWPDGPELPEGVPSFGWQPGTACGAFLKKARELGIHDD